MKYEVKSGGCIGAGSYWKFSCTSSNWPEDVHTKMQSGQPSLDHLYPITVRKIPAVHEPKTCEILQGLSLR